MPNTAKYYKPKFTAYDIHDNVGGPCEHEDQHERWLGGQLMCEMSNSHLNNSLKWLREHEWPDPDSLPDEYYERTWIEECLEDEIQRRKDENIMILDKTAWQQV